MALTREKAAEKKGDKGPTDMRALQAMIEEINSDIVGYGGRYDRCLFVIYDLGFIRDTAQFSRDIEGNPSVHVLIVKK